MKQREAVYNAVCEVMDAESFDEAVTPSKDERTQINLIVFNGIRAGDVDFSDSATAKYDTDAKLNSYVSGLVSNWLRKDKNLNGGVVYTPKNPGSRTGQGDAQVRELRKLLSIHKGTEHETQIQSYIDKRLETIKAEKAAEIEIDAENLPEELRDLVA
jgi:hypothetical protein